MDKEEQRRKGAFGPLPRQSDERHRGTLNFFGCARALDDLPGTGGGGEGAKGTGREGSCRVMYGRRDHPW